MYILLLLFLCLDSSLPSLASKSGSSRSGLTRPFSPSRFTSQSHTIQDPPWPNKSASRSSSYSEIDIYSLFDLQLPSLLTQTNLTTPCLVGVWVTNKPKFRRFVKRRLFPDWQLDLAAEEWFWVKITASEIGGRLEDGGMPIFNLDNSHRRAYEGVFCTF